MLVGKRSRDPSSSRLFRSIFMYYDDHLNTATQIANCQMRAFIQKIGNQDEAVVCVKQPEHFLVVSAKWARLV